MALVQCEAIIFSFIPFWGELTRDCGENYAWKSCLLHSGVVFLLLFLAALGVLGLFFGKFWSYCGMIYFVSINVLMEWFDTVLDIAWLVISRFCLFVLWARGLEHMFFFYS